VPKLLTLIYLSKKRCLKTLHLIKIVSRALKRQSEKNKIKKLKLTEVMALQINQSSICTKLDTTGGSLMIQ
jgi:hypothetical protein